MHAPLGSVEAVGESLIAEPKVHTASESTVEDTSQALLDSEVLPEPEPTESAQPAFANNAVMESYEPPQPLSEESIFSFAERTVTIEKEILGKYLAERNRIRNVETPPIRNVETLPIELPAETEENLRTISGSTIPHCRKCGMPLEAGSRFCGECGSQLETRIPACHLCGAPLAPTAKFCGECGSQRVEPGVQVKDPSGNGAGEVHESPEQFRKPTQRNWLVKLLKRAEQ